MERELQIDKHDLEYNAEEAKREKPRNNEGNGADIKDIYQWLIP